MSLAKFKVYLKVKLKFFLSYPEKPWKLQKTNAQKAKYGEVNGISNSESKQET